MKKEILSRPALHYILIALIGILIYSNTFSVPFHFDDKQYMINNSLIKDFDYFLNPSKIDSLNEDIKHYSRTRQLAYLTFWANYKFGGEDVTGYHFVNILIHVINALLVYLTVRLIFKTPFLIGSAYKERSWLIALFSGLLFVAHPVQTMAVTYILQRWASLTAMFYLLSLVFYMNWRLQIIKNQEANNAGFHISDFLTLIFYLLSLLFAVLAMNTKEIAFTLPVMLALCEFIFLKGCIKKRLFCLIPLFATMLIIPYAYINLNMDPQSLSATLVESTKRWGSLDRLDYLFSQFRVITKYIELIFFPVNQSIYHDNMVFHLFLEPPVFSSFIFLLFIFCFGIYMYLLSRRGEPIFRLISFAIFWFFLTLSVESSVLPIMDTLAEYRLYLPSAGAFMAISSGVVLISMRFNNFKKTIALASVVTVIILSCATYARNTVWQSEISLWEDTVKKAPSNPFGHYFLGQAYDAKGMDDKAIEHFRSAAELDPLNPRSYNSLGIIYHKRGLIDNAIQLYQIALKVALDYADAYNNLGVAYRSKGMTDKAIEHYRTALALSPDYAQAHYNLGLVYLDQGLKAEARGEFDEALRIDPDYVNARESLGRLGGKQ